MSATQKSSSSQKNKTEIIGIASGKGGTGKTLVAASLGYTLVNSGHKVLMVDGDPGTDGLSLFLLGSKGMRQIKGFDGDNTFTGLLRRFGDGDTSLQFEPQQINRNLSEDDHNVIYTAIISGRGIYGDEFGDFQSSPVPDLTQATFQKAINSLFEEIKRLDEFDYVIVDTRGGFAFESTDICALTDSFIVVTEADYTSFYQDRNLVKRINATAERLGRQPLLRAMIVNKATEDDGQERQFRLALEEALPVTLNETYPIPLDIEAMKAYKVQQIPYRVAAASTFSHASLSAFADILQLVTAKWSEEHIGKWNSLVAEVSAAVKARHEEREKLAQARQALADELQALRQQFQQSQAQIKYLEEEKSYSEERFTREIQRADELRQHTEKLAQTRQPGWPTFWRALLVFGILVSLGIGFWIFSQKAGTDKTALLTAIYSAETPVNLKRRYLIELIELGEKDFKGLDLSSTDLSGESLANVVLDKADFRNADLTAADFTGTSLVGANFGQAILKDTKFTNASLRDARFSEIADLAGSDFSGANLHDTQISLGRLAMAKTNSKTVLPNGSPGPLTPDDPRIKEDLMQQQQK